MGLFPQDLELVSHLISLITSDDASFIILIYYRHHHQLHTLSIYIYIYIHIIPSTIYTYIYILRDLLFYRSIYLSTNNDDFTNE